MKPECQRKGWGWGVERGEGRWGSGGAEAIRDYCYWQSCTLMGYTAHCLSPNQPESINHLPQQHISDQSGRWGPCCPPTPIHPPPRPPCCAPTAWFQVSQGDEHSQHRGRATSEHLADDSIFKSRLINVNVHRLKTNLEECFYSCMFSLLAH